MKTFALALLFIAASGRADSFPRQVVKDARDLGTAPFRWRQPQWTRFGEGVAIVVGAYVVDDQIVRFAAHQQNAALNDYLRGVTHLGGGYGLDLAAVLAAGGWIGHDEKMMDAGIDALESSFAASGIVTPAIKHVIGRARPFQDLGKHSFHPFTKYDSFPSGHATNAFAIATAVATRYEDNRYVPAIAYTLAISVAVARVHDRVHFASDVLAGGMIGHAIAKSITLNHKRVHVAWNGTSVRLRW